MQQSPHTLESTELVNGAVLCGRADKRNLDMCVTRYIQLKWNNLKKSTCTTSTQN